MPLAICSPDRRLPWMVWSCVLLLLGISSCNLFDSHNEEEDCTERGIFTDCSASPGDMGKLELAVTVSSAQPLVRVDIYQGRNFETGTWMGYEMVGRNGLEMTLPVGSYSAVAQYVRGADTIRAVDGGSISMSETEYCDGTCYSMDDADLDLRLNEDLLKELKDSEGS